MFIWLRKLQFIRGHEGQIPENFLYVSPQLAAQGRVGKRQEAIECYNNAIELDSKCVDAWLNKGTVLKNWGEHEKADECYDRVIVLDSRNIKAWSGKLDLCEGIIMLNFANVQAWNNRGNALRNLGRCDEALKAFNISVELDSRFAAAWYNKGITLYDLKSIVSHRCYGKATRLDPLYAKAWYAKGLALMSRAENEKDIKAFDAAIKTDPQCIKAWRAKAIALRSLGHAFEADVASAVANGLG
jgi:tetratricopeptide (TPR) repeat protein